MDENGWNQQQDVQPTPQDIYNDLKERMPDGIMEKLPESVSGRIEDAVAELERKSQDPYEHVDTHSKKIDMPKVPLIAAVVIGFLGAIIFAKSEPLAALLCIGIMFLVIGLGAVTSKGFSFQRDAMTLIFPLVGLLLTVAPGYLLLAKKIPDLPQPAGNTSAIVAGAVCVVMGASILIFGAISRNYKKKHCTEIVQATCVHLKEKVERSNGHTKITYSPIFEFQYLGYTYNVSENYSNIGVPKVGETLEIHIDPKEPTEFYRKELKSGALVTVVCIIFILVGLLGIFAG